MRTCRKCGVTKPLESFAPRQSVPNGRRHECKECTAEYLRAYAAANAERLREKRRRYYLDNKAELLAKQREYKASHQAEKAAWWREYYAKNAGQRRESSRRYYAQNKDRAARNSRLWRERNRERTREILRQSKYRRRASAVTNGGHHTPEEWEWVKHRYGCCVRCGDRTAALTRDHVVPVAMGGSDDIENIQPLCHRCNCSKNARIMDYRTEFHLDW